MTASHGDHCYEETAEVLCSADHEHTDRCPRRRVKRCGHDPREAD